MERRLTVHKKYLCIPVKTAGREEQHLETLEIFQDDNKIFEIRIPVDEQDESGSYDYPRRAQGGDGIRQKAPGGGVPRPEGMTKILKCQTQQYNSCHS